MIGPDLFSDPDLDLRSHLTLGLVPGLGPKLTQALLDRFGSAKAVLQANFDDLISVPLVGEKLARSFSDSFRSIRVDTEIELIKKFDVGLWLKNREGYPPRVNEITTAPPMLYYRGDYIAADRRAVGIVGSRSCTSYGKKITEQIASGLARSGWTVVSGLARGIDGVAHHAALEAGGRTIASLAGGLSRIYPPEHKELADRIAKQGCLMTETPMTVDPQPGMFPARNRIISALSMGVVIIEANAKSGALITASHAADQGRDVFVVPGNVDSAASAGCLELIRKGARLIRGVDDLLEDLQGIQPLEEAPVKKTLFDQVPAIPSQPPGLTDVQMQIWQALDQSQIVDELSRSLKLSTGDLLTALLQMELRRVVRRLPGNRFERR